MNRRSHRFQPHRQLFYPKDNPYPREPALSPVIIGETEGETGPLIISTDSGTRWERFIGGGRRRRIERLFHNQGTTCARLQLGYQLFSLRTTDGRCLRSQI